MVLHSEDGPTLEQVSKGPLSLEEPKLSSKSWQSLV